MEQAINSFQKGINLDFHPMQQDNTSLTDALNATFITMNGNETVLQNDMGNAQIQNSYLPKGYVPVGMKEFGGVIYVAAYNPITNRSQIGSFPSPQRRFFNKDSNEGFIDLNQLYEHVPYLGSNDYLVSQRNLLIPISSDQLLRAGDKFIIYSRELSNIKQYISNWDNTLLDKLFSPKNKYLTLSVGILNSRNEFVDITKNLMRFDLNDKEINFDESDFDEFKFNSGYFIVSEYSDDEIDIDEYRKLDTLSLNTYSNKLVGPLYIKVELNLPIDFEYSIEGNKNDDNEYELIIHSRIKYNCPDGIETQDSFNVSLSITNESIKYFIDNESSNDEIIFLKPNGSVPREFPNQLEIKRNDKKIYLPGGQEASSQYKVTVNSDGNSTYQTYLDKQIPTLFGICLYNFGATTLLETKFGETSYDVITNQYTVEATSSYTLNPESNVWSYTIAPVIKNCPLISSAQDYNLIIYDIAQSGQLELDKLNYGIMDLTSWRFYNDLENKNTSIAYSFNSYPKSGHEFRNLQFDFWKVEGDVSIGTNHPVTLNGAKYIGTYKPQLNFGYNGSFDDIIDWESLQNDFPYDTIDIYDSNGDTYIKTLDLTKSGESTFHGLLPHPIILDTFYYGNDEFKINALDAKLNSYIDLYDLDGYKYQNYVGKFSNSQNVNSLNSKEMYQVVIKWEDYNLENQEIYDYQYDCRWLLTTELFNNSYSIFSDTFIRDFCNPTEDEQSFYDSLITIQPHLNSTNQEINKNSSEEEIGSQFYTEQPTKVEWGYDTKYKIKVSDTIKIDWNQNLYPSYIEVQEPTIHIVEQNIKVVNNTHSWNVTGSQEIPTISTINYNIISDSQHQRGNFLLNNTLNITLLDRLFSNPTNSTDNIYAEFLFSKFSEYIRTSETNKTTNGNKYISISPAIRDTSNTRPELFVYASYGPQQNNFRNITDNRMFGHTHMTGAVYSNLGNSIYYKKQDGDYLQVKSSEIIDSLMNGLNSVYPLEDGVFLIEGTCPIKSGSLNSDLILYDFIWVRTKRGTDEYGWGMLNHQKTDNNGLFSPYIDNIINNMENYYGAFQKGQFIPTSTSFYIIDYSNYVDNNFYEVDINYSCSFVINKQG